MAHSGAEDKTRHKAATRHVGKGGHSLVDLCGERKSHFCPASDSFGMYEGSIVMSTLWGHP